MSRWTDFITSWAKNNNVSYGCAMTDPEMKKAYYEKFPKQTKEETKKQKQEKDKIQSLKSFKISVINFRDKFVKPFLENKDGTLRNEMMMKYNKFSKDLKDYIKEKAPSIHEIVTGEKKPKEEKPKEEKPKEEKPKEEKPKYTKDLNKILNRYYKKLFDKIKETNDNVSEKKEREIQSKYSFEIEKLLKKNNIKDVYNESYYFDTRSSESNKPSNNILRFLKENKLNEDDIPNLKKIIKYYEE